MAVVSYGVDRPPVNNQVPQPQRGASPAPPNLAALIAEHGSYTQITLAAWAAYDSAVAKWRAARVARLRDLQLRNASQVRATARKPAIKAKNGGLL